MELKETLSDVGFTKEFIDHMKDYESTLRNNGLDNSFPEVNKAELETVCYSESLMLEVKNEAPIFSL